MELKFNLGFDQLIKLVRQLPANQIARLKAELEGKNSVTKTKSEISEFQKFLLKGPVMTEEQFEDFKKNRKQFSLWRQK